MIKLITDLMSDSRVQARIIDMIESRLKTMDVEMATRLVLMAMTVCFKTSSLCPNYNNLISNYYIIKKKKYIA